MTVQHPDRRAIQWWFCLPWKAAKGRKQTFVTSSYRPWAVLWKSLQNYGRFSDRQIAGIKKPRIPWSTGLLNVGAKAGIEPAWADLQSTIFSLKISSLRIIRFRNCFIFWQLNAKHMKGSVMRCGTDLVSPRTASYPLQITHSAPSQAMLFLTEDHISWTQT